MSFTDTLVGILILVVIVLFIYMRMTKQTLTEALKEIKDILTKKKEE